MRNSSELGNHKGAPQSLSSLTRGGYAGFSDASEPVQRRTFLEAAGIVEARLEAAVQRQEPIGVETVLSSDKYRSLVERVRRQDGFVGLIYVTVAPPEVACQRIARRVRAGGHDVPVEKVRARWHRLLSNLAWFAARASAFWVFDNSDERPEVPPRLVATGRLGMVEIIDPSAGDALLSSPKLCAMKCHVAWGACGRSHGAAMR